LSFNDNILAFFCFGNCFGYFFKKLGELTESSGHLAFKGSCSGSEIKEKLKFLGSFPSPGKFLKLLIFYGYFLMY